MRDETGSNIQVMRIFEKLVRRWPWMIGFGALGFVLAFGFTLLRPALYQSEAILTLNIHYGVSEPLALIVEDRVLSRVASFVESDQVVSMALEQLPETLRTEQGWHGAADMDAVLHLDRRMDKWALQARHQDPSIAQQVAQAWADVSVDALAEAQTHARTASRLLESDFIVDCDETFDEQLPTQIWECVAYPGEGSSPDLDQTLQQEIALSNGVLPNITYDLSKDARLPADPILYRRVWLLSAGTVAGWVLGLMLSVTLPMGDAGRKRNEGSRG